MSNSVLGDADESKWRVTCQNRGMCRARHRVCVRVKDGGANLSRVEIRGVEGFL